MSQSLATLLCAARLAEKKCLDALKGKLEIIDDPDVHKQFQDHVVETQWQMKLLEACMEFQGIPSDYFCPEAHRMVSELPRKDVYTIKQLEIDLYKKILLAARMENASETMQACREILGQETAMAEWMEMNLPCSNMPFIMQENAVFATVH
jgi:ferritin-like metal-binding protein YciE